MDIFTLVGSIVLEGVDAAQTQLEGMNGFVENNKKAFQTAGVAVTAFGASIVGSLTMAVKAAADEETGVQRLRTALNNVGVSYDNVKVSLEGVIAATQKKTGISDNEQRAALAQLVATTGDYDKALSLLPTALDLAAGKGMDYTSAAEVVGRVTGMADGYAGKRCLLTGAASGIGRSTALKLATPTCLA